MTKKLTAIDLFSGCGGLTKGLKDAGFSVLGAVEIDDKACQTYTLNHPEVPVFKTDIRQLDSKQLLKEVGIRKGELDLLAGCPPCQGFSMLRRRNRSMVAPDARNELIAEFERLAIALRPKFVMMENVPSLATYDKFQSLVIALERAGYIVTTKTLDVALYGVPQRRKRLILCASRIGVPHLATPSQKRLTVRDVISTLSQAGKSGDALHDLQSTKRTSRIQALISAIPKDGGSRQSLPKSMQLECHKKTSGFNDVYGRMKWDEVSPTITSGCINPSKGRFLHPQEDRPITLREAAMLQGFPSNYKFDVSHGRRAIGLMIGNALPPPFIAAHTKAIATSLRAHK